MVKDEMVGRYRILQTATPGPKVRRSIAEDTLLERKVVLSFLLDRRLDEEFHRVKPLLRLGSPFCQRILDLGSVDGGFYLVTEFVPGRSLVDFDGKVSGAAYRSRNQLLRYLYQLAMALQEMHAVGVVHGAISPENVILRDENSLCLLHTLDAWACGVTEVQEDIRGFGRVLRRLSEPGSLLMRVAEQAVGGGYSSIEACFSEVQRLFPDYFS